MSLSGEVKCIIAGMFSAELEDSTGSMDVGPSTSANFGVEALDALSSSKLKILELWALSDGIVGLMTWPFLPATVSTRKLWKPEVMSLLLTKSRSAVPEMTSLMGFHAGCMADEMRWCEWDTIMRWIGLPEI